MPEPLAQAGFLLLPAVFTPDQCNAMIAGIESALADCQDDSTALRRRTGALYGARNLLELWPEVAAVWQCPRLLDLIRDVLGCKAGLVRVLYFDKPPSATWSLPWHQDMTIAVEDNSLPSPCFVNPTRKAGVPHVEASRELLQQMLTLRIHLDAATAENGPLQVLPGSHLPNDAKKIATKAAARTVLANRGDVLAMRPLLMHASGSSRSGTTQHRRILHLEFTGVRTLPDGYRWHDYHACLSAMNP